MQRRASKGVALASAGGGGAAAAAAGAAAGGGSRAEALGDALDRLDSALRSGDSVRVTQLLQSGAEVPSLAKLRSGVSRVKATLEDGEKSPKTPSSKTPKGGAAASLASALGQPRGSVSGGSGALARGAAGTSESISRAESIADTATLRSKYNELAVQCEGLQEKVRKLEEERKRSLEANISRASSMEETISSLKAQLAEASSRRRVAQGELKRLHTNINGVIDDLHNKTAESMKEHELDLIRSFRTRLLDVQKQLHQERSRQDQSSLEWIEKAQTLSKKLDWAKEEALRLDGLNQMLTRENNRLRTQFRAQEGDREHYIKQVVALKRELARVREELAQRESEAGAQLEQRAMHERALAKTAPDIISHEVGNKEERLKNEITRLHKMLQQTRKQLKNARSAQVKILAERTELQAFLRQAIADVQAEVLQARQASESGMESRYTMDVADLGPQERARVLEILLSKERVVSLLYDKAFPSQYAPGHAEANDADDADDSIDADERYATRRQPTTVDRLAEQLAAAAAGRGGDSADIESDHSFDDAY